MWSPPAETRNRSAAPCRRMAAAAGRAAGLRCRRSGRAGSRRPGSPQVGGCCGSRPGSGGHPVVGQCPPSVVLFKLPRTYRCAVIRRMTNVWPSNTTVWTLPVARSARLSDIPLVKADHLFSATIPGSYDLSDPGLDIEIWRRRAKRCGYLSAIGRLPVGNHIDRSGHQIRICAPARRQPQGDGVEAIVEPRQDVMLVVRDLGLAGQWLAAAERSKGEQQQPRPSGGRGGQLLAHC